MKFKSQEIKLSDIKISGAFKARPPKSEKIQRCYDFYATHHAFDRTIILDKKHVLLDGYVTYLVAKMFNVNTVHAVIITGNQLELVEAPNTAQSPIEPPKEDKPRFKAGDKAKVIANGSGHQAKIGEVVTISGETDRPRCCSAYPDGTRTYQMYEYCGYIAELDLEPLPTFSWDDFKSGKIAVHCDTEEKAKAFCKEVKSRFPDKTRAWSDGGTNWETYKEQTIYDIWSDGRFCFGRIDGVAIELGYTIVESPFTPEPELFVTRKMLEKLGACSGGVSFFDEHYPDGKAEYTALIDTCHDEDHNDYACWVNHRKSRIEQMQNEPEQEPKYYNGKVVCVVSGKTGLTQGKVYEVVNGYMIDDNGSSRPNPEPFGPQKSITDGFLRAWFIEYKGE